MNPVRAFYSGDTQTLISKYERRWPTRLIGCISSQKGIVPLYRVQKTFDMGFKSTHVSNECTRLALPSTWHSPGQSLWVYLPNLASLIGEVPGFVNNFDGETCSLKSFGWLRRLDFDTDKVHRKFKPTFVCLKMFFSILVSGTPVAVNIFWSKSQLFSVWYFKIISPSR